MCPSCILLFQGVKENLTLFIIMAYIKVDPFSFFLNKAGSLCVVFPFNGKSLTDIIHELSVLMVIAYFVMGHHEAVHNPL